MVADQEGEPTFSADPGADAPEPLFEGRAASVPPPVVSAAVVAAFLARSDDLMILLDRDGTVLWASPSCERFCGIPAAQLVGMACTDLIHPADRDRAATAVSEVAQSGDHVSFEGRMVGEGRAPWVELVLTNLLDEPELGGIVGHVRDITERRRTEEEVQFQASVLDAVGQAITARDLDGIAIFWNPAATDLFGYTAEEMLGRRMGDLIAPAPGYEEHLEGASRAHLDAQPWSGLAVMTAKDGTTVHVQSTSTPVFDRDGNHLGTITASHDLREILEEQRRSEEDRRRLADAQASANLGSFELDLRTGEFLGSDEFWRIIGREPSNLGALDHVHPDDLPVFTAAFLEARDANAPVACTHRIVRPDGVIRWVTTRSSQFHSAGTDVLAGTVLDITEHHEAEQALIHQATHDPLTGLLHSRAFVDQLSAMLEQDPATTGRLALLLLDLDHFKSVNDRLGHVDADDVLRQLGQRLTAALPSGTVIGRLGGDEFVICLDPFGHGNGVQPLLDDVRRALAQPLEVRGTVVSLDASIGIADTDNERTAEQLLRNADLAMYSAKRRGRGRAEYFDEVLAAEELRRTRLIDDLRTALETGALETHFQPEYDLQSGALFGFEALARWSHPELGRIGPDEFIPLAEESGLIEDLGRQMLTNAGACLARWNRRWPDNPLTIGVNVSPFQLSDPALPDDVHRVIVDNRLEPRQLCLEVTESTLMDESDVAESVGQLHANGATIAIDDFGTGYSSFGRLKVLTVDFLKIDQSFVAGIGRSSDDETIITTMATLARALGVGIIAEGIETEAQHSFLTDIGCEYGQGYLWSPALDEAGATALIERGSPTVTAW